MQTYTVILKALYRMQLVACSGDSLWTLMGSYAREDNWTQITI